MTSIRTSARILTLCLAAATLAAGSLHAQSSTQSSPNISANASSTSPHNWTTEQIVTATVSDAWQLSGKNEAAFFDIVQQLAEISAHNRGLVLPESEEAGKRAGEFIKKKAKADHDQLLYAVVDEAVRKVGTKAPAAAPAQ